MKVGDGRMYPGGLDRLEERSEVSNRVKSMLLKLGTDEKSSNAVL